MTTPLISLCAPLLQQELTKSPPTLWQLCHTVQNKGLMEIQNNYKHPQMLHKQGYAIHFLEALSTSFIHLHLTSCEFSILLMLGLFSEMCLHFNPRYVTTYFCQKVQFCHHVKKTKNPPWNSNCTIID